MSVLVWGSPCDEIQMVLKRVLDALPCEGGLCEQVFPLGSLEDLKRHILALRPDVTVLALAPGSSGDLQRLLELGLLLRDQRIVLLLPDERPETLAVASRLRPRYSALVSSEPEEVAAVVRKVVCSGQLSSQRRPFGTLARKETT